MTLLANRKKRMDTTALGWGAVLRATGQPEAFGSTPMITTAVLPCESESAERLL